MLRASRSFLNLSFILWMLLPSLWMAQAYSPLHSGHPYTSNWQTFMRQGQQYLHEGRYHLARDATMQALNFIPFAEASAPLYQQLAWAYVGLNEAGLATASLQTAIRLSSSNTVYYQNMVDVWQRFQQIEQAKQQLADTLRYEPEQGDGWFLLGLIYLVEENTNATQTAWQQHLLLHPRSGHRSYICSHSSVCQIIKAN